MKKRPLYILLLVILGFTVFYSGFCPNLCSASHKGLDFICPISSLSSALMEAGFFMSFSLILMGILLLTKIIITPEELVFLHYRPPRFQF